MFEISENSLCILSIEGTSLFVPYPSANSASHKLRRKYKSQKINQINENNVECQSGLISDCMLKIKCLQRSWHCTGLISPGSIDLVWTLREDESWNEAANLSWKIHFNARARQFVEVSSVERENGTSVHWNSWRCYPFRNHSRLNPSNWTDCWCIVIRYPLSSLSDYSISNCLCAISFLSLL